MDRVDCVVIGAGVVGLAIARGLGLSGRRVIILERETSFGTGISSRNSEVIHAGIHYPKDSLKARLCVAGQEQLYAYCASRRIDHRRCGKLTVATSPAEIPALESALSSARANGADDLVWLDGEATIRLEPSLSATAALLSPSTGIVDARGYMLSLLADAESAGAVIATATEVTRIALDNDGAAIWTAGEAEPVLQARLVVNAAGLGALHLARRMEGFPVEHVPPGWYAKGNYFALAGRSPFSRLIYPVPEPGGLGTHLTLDLAGAARFGPDIEWVASPDYRVDPSRAGRFTQAIRRYWPGLPDGALVPAYAGVRPKLSGPGQPAADFHITGAEIHGVRGIINLFGIESPGLTASLAIADEVLRLADGSA